MQDNAGNSSLISASYAGHVNVVELPLSNGANANDKTTTTGNSSQ